MALPTKSNVSRPLAWGYDALIEYGPNPPDSLYLRLAVGPGRQMGFETAPPEEKGPNLADNPEDMRPESGAIFSRSSFSGGEGLDFAHRRDGTDRDWSRFWDSRNVDVRPGKPGEPAEVKLLHSASSLRAAAHAFAIPIATIGTTLYSVLSDVQQVDRTADPTAAVPTWTTENPHAGQAAGNVRDLAALGNELYAPIVSSGIHKRDTLGTWTHWSDLGAVQVWAAKARIIASDGSSLYEARAGAGSVLLHSVAGEEWLDVVDAGEAILAACSDGHIYVFVSEEGELVLRGQTLLEGGEIPFALGYARGLVFIGTSRATTAGGRIGRLWRALFVGLHLRNAEVLRTWGGPTETSDRVPRRIIATRESVVMAVPEDGTETHVWRYHLETGGLSRDLIIGASITPGLNAEFRGIAVVDDRLFVGIRDDALWRENTAFASTGYLIGALADFFNAGRKAWAGARLTTGVLPTGTQVVLAYSTDPAAIEDPAHSSWKNIITATPAAPGDSAETVITGVESRYIAGRLTLTPNGTNTATPTVLAYAFRGRAVPTENDYLLPVNISDRVERPFRKRFTSNGVGLDVHDKLQDLVGKVVTTTLLRTGEVVKGQLESVSTPIEELPQRGSATVYALVKLRGQRQ